MRPPAPHQVLRCSPFIRGGSRPFLPTSGSLTALVILALLAAGVCGCGRERAGGNSAGGLLRPSKGGDLPREGLTFGGVVMECDGDGWPDLLVSRHGNQAELYLNRGSLRFVRPGRAGIPFPGELPDQHGAAVCDFDLDGDDDVFHAVGGDEGRGLAWKCLWRQNGAGRFEEASGRDPILADPVGRGRGALWLDLDGDFRPELLLMNYQSQARLLKLAGGSWQDLTDRLPTPPAVPLWRPGQAAPLPEERKRSNWVHGAVAADLDGDGLTDLLALGRPGWSGAWGNAGGGRLRDLTCYWGLAAAFFPEVPAHAAAGDVDEDGDLDLILAYRPESHESRFVPGRLQLWLQEPDEGGVLFRPVEIGGPGAQEASIEAVLLVDLDNDGHLDVYALRHRPTGGAGADMLLLGDGSGRFERASDPGWLGGGSGRAESIWAADLDRDGDLDLVRFAGGGVDPALGGGIELVENRAPGRGLVLELAGRHGSPHGMGARVELRLPGGRTLLREVQALATPHSGSVPPVHFGVGDLTGPLTVLVRWPGGEAREVVLPESGRAYRLDSAGGRAVALPARWQKGGGS